MYKRCIVVKAAGRQIGREQSVDWYDVPFRRLIDEYFNTGDSAVFDSTLRLVKFDRYDDLNIDEPVDWNRVPALKQADCIVLRASNYIHEHMDWTNFLPWLEALEVPVICCGIGAQSAVRVKMNLPPEHVRIWKMISERTKSIGVRGVYTAEILNDLGIHNVEVVGCPTLFRSRDPNHHLKNTTLEPGQKVSFSMRRETGAGYTVDSAGFLELQKRLIAKFAEVFDLFLTAHGEVEEKAIYYHDPVRMDEAIKKLRDSRWFEGENSKLEQLYRSRLFFTTAVATMDDFNRAMTGTIGYRVHGVLPALSVGTPSILLKYDARSEELAQTLDVPLLDPREAMATPIDELFNADRFANFQAKFGGHYQDMKRFIESNNVESRM